MEMFWALIVVSAAVITSTMLLIRRYMKKGIAPFILSSSGDKALLDVTSLHELWRNYKVRPSALAVYPTGDCPKPSLGHGVKLLYKKLPHDARGDPYASEKYFKSDKDFVSFIRRYSKDLMMVRSYGVAISGTSLGQSGAIGSLGLSSHASLMVNLIISKEDIPADENIFKIIEYLETRRPSLFQGITILMLNAGSRERDEEVDELHKLVLSTLALYASSSPRSGLEGCKRAGLELEKVLQHYGNVLVSTCIYAALSTEGGIRHISLDEAPIHDGIRLLKRLATADETEFVVPGAFLFAVSRSYEDSVAIASMVSENLQRMGVPVLGESYLYSERVVRPYALVLYLIDPAFLESHRIFKVIAPWWCENLKGMAMELYAKVVESLERCEDAVKKALHSKELNRSDINNLMRALERLRKLSLTLAMMGVFSEELMLRFEVLGETLKKLLDIKDLEGKKHDLIRKVRILETRAIAHVLKGRKDVAAKLKSEAHNIKEEVKRLSEDIERCWGELGSAFQKP